VSGLARLSVVRGGLLDHGPGSIHVSALADKKIGSIMAQATSALLKKDNPADICLTCHADKKYEPTKIMWKNTTDANGHITADHSFGVMPYESFGDDPATKPVEIKTQATVDMVKKALPKLAK